ncbi:MAG: MBL fold metallo-hydrolase, partial [Ruminiclostridium sp.]|nr:MBL fold metallo-hydrolase [Ruminiclostridium sp.]
MGNETNIGVPLPADKVTERKNKAEGLRAGVLTPNGAGFKTAYMQEYGNATRGQCPCCSPNGAYPTIIAGNDSDKVVWDQTKYAFLSSRYGAAGTSKDFTNNDALRVHPTLWNNGTNNVLSGVFEVLPGKIYQVRGYDMANISFVKSNNLTSSSLSSGDHWLVMDTLMSQECTEAALELFQDFLQKTVPGYTLKGNIYGIIISHSHVDHYGGMKAVSGYFPNTGAAGIVVPQGFDEAATSENVYVGNAMGRRASYQYGSFIKPKYTNAKTDAGDYLSGSISIGIGQGQSTGTIGYCAPTEWIAENGETTIDEL